jgi:hypothetical protein
MKPPSHDSHLHFRWTRPSSAVRYGWAMDEQRIWKQALIGDSATEEWADRYDPLVEGHRLLDELGKLQTDPDAMVAFATKWGFLSKPIAMRPRKVCADLAIPDFQGEAPALESYWAEPIALWDREVRAFQTSFQMWSALGSKEDALLLDQIRAWAAGPRIPADLAIEFGDVTTQNAARRAGWIKLGIDVSGQLRRLRVTPALYFDAERGRGALRVSPTSLIGAAWLQLAEAADGRYRPRRCFCGSWFVLNPASKNQQGRFCSNACKQKWYRWGCEARGLAATGKKLAPIARTLSRKVGYPVTAKDVREWIANGDRWVPGAA